MAIVHMDKQVSKFFNQLNLHDDKLYPEPQFFDYEEKQDVYKYDEEEIISLRDFDIQFGLIVTQKGVYEPGNDCLQPPGFIVDSTEVEIENLIVWDNVYGEELRFNREEFTEIVNTVRTFIVI